MSRAPRLYARRAASSSRNPGRAATCGCTAVEGRWAVACQWTPSAAIDYIVTRLALSDVEVFGVMFLDAQLRMIAFEEMFRGTLSETSVYPREVVKAAIRHNAHSILIAHNHPSGSSQPSRADVEVTRRLKDAVALVNVTLVDHVIVAAGSGHSMAKMGLI